MNGESDPFDALDRIDPIDPQTARAYLDEWLVGPGDDPQTTVPWLAALEPLTYDQYRLRVAERAQVRVETVDTEVERFREAQQGSTQASSDWASQMPYDSQSLQGPYYPTCNICGYTGPIAVRKKVSTAGWVVFAALLVTTCVFCWVGLLITEEVRYCPSCDARYLLPS